MSAVTDKLANLNTVLDQAITALNAKSQQVTDTVSALNAQVADLQAQVANGNQVSEADLDGLATKLAQIMTAINAIPPVAA